VNETESRFTRHRRFAREIYREPRTIRTHLLQGFVSLWSARGGGFYGLGWSLTFIALEVQFFVSEVAQSNGIFDFVGGQLIEYVLRFGLMSVVNSLLALVWPVHVLQWLGGYGIVVLIAGFFAFEHFLRPLVEGRFPELAMAREQSALRKAEKKARKASRRDKRGNRGG